MQFKSNVPIAKIWHIGKGREKIPHLCIVEDSKKKKVRRSMWSYSCAILGQRRR